MKPEKVNPKKLEITEVESSALDVIETNERILSISVAFRHIICITTQDIQVFQKGNSFLKGPASRFCFPFLTVIRKT